MKKDRRKYGKAYGTSMIILVAISLFTFAYGKGWAVDWRFYGEDDDGSYYYDVNSITRQSNNVVRVSEKMVFTEKGRTEIMTELGKQFKGLNYSTALFEHDCIGKKFHTLEMAGYSKDENVLFRWEMGNVTQWENMAPGSVGEKLYKIVCKQPKK